ncbi:MAG TPA: hypothetical protein VNA69_01705 [Thermoanaerobaculia bacterium]|nr:hypothetical protein [Thermoanaerobaculia bacterium]
MNKRFTWLCSFTARAAFALALAAPLFAQVADGDRHWAMRAQNKAEHIDAAIASYQRAVAANANDLEAQWKLLRAYRFKGAYVAASADEKKKVYGTAKIAGEKARAAVDKVLGVNAKTPEKQVAEAARKHPGAAEVYLWDAVNWGEWALAYGKMAAAREGAADRIRRQATIAHLVDPRLDNGTPSRVLGRLHDQTPRIPFITGWASSKEAVRFLEESYRIDPANKTTVVFLAEALVAHDSKTRPRAIKLLRDMIAAPNHPDWLIEDMASVDDAKALLRKWE